jgi:hypothetical protein
MWAHETELPTEAFYGWGRKDLPVTFKELVNIEIKELAPLLTKLSSVEAQKLESALVSAVREKIIPESFTIAEAVGDLRGLNNASRIVTVQVLDAETGQPLTRYRVTTTETTANNQQLGIDLTDNEGIFSFEYALAPGDETAHRFRFDIIASAGNQLPSVDEIALGPQHTTDEVVKLLVKLPAPGRLSLKDLAKDISLAIPDQVINQLKDQNVLTFADLRKRGGMAELRPSIQADDTIMRRLDSLTDLDRISADLKTNNHLIEKHYESVAAIANSDRSRFISDLTELVGDFHALRLHTLARAQTNFLNNILAGRHVEQANGFILSDEDE